MRRGFWITSMLAVLLAGCSTTTQPVQSPTEQTTSQAAPEFKFMHTTTLDSANPFAEKGALPFGLIDFTKIRTEHYLPAIEAGMAQQIEEIAQIADQADEPTFENTMIPLEKSGELLNRVYPYFSNDAGANTNDEIKAIQKELAPKLAAHEDAIWLNEKLFKRVETLYDKRSDLGLDAESLRLLEEYYKDFVRNGAKLTPEQKNRISEINAELASLTTIYGQNILAEMNDSAVIVDTAAELDGFTDEQISAAAELAKTLGSVGKYAVAIVNTSIQPALKSLRNRELRRRIHEASVNRGLRDNASNNAANALRILALRTERVNMLGYPTYADYIVDTRVAHTVKAVNDMMQKLIEPAKASLEREKAELQAIADAQNAGISIEAHDWFFYAEQLRKQKYDLDDNALKPYFELNNVITNGVFYAANQLYGVTFVERHDIPVYNPDVKVFEVFDADGKSMALFIGDYFARPSKRGGAWKSGFSTQSWLTGDEPIIINQINIPKPAGDAPALLTFEEVTTLFHEFGHALHGMFSRATYPRFGGTQVPRDFVEFPSQFNEIWATWPEILKNYAVHYQTGEQLPEELIQKVIAAGQFNQGYATTEYLGAAVLDQKWHQLTLEQIQAMDASKLAEIEKSLLAEAGLDIPTTPPRYRTAYYNHVFAGGYAAGYYSYIWSEVLDADGEAWFKSHGLSRENGDHFRNTVLSKGYTEDSMKLYRDFTGGDPSIEPLLIRRGLK